MVKDKPEEKSKYEPHIRLTETLSVLSPNCQETLRSWPLGGNVRCCFSLESNCTFLNNGSYGTAPSCVLAAQSHYNQLREVNPDRFMRKHRAEFLTRSRKSLADFVGSDVDDLVLVTNATTGVNSVLRSLDFQDGDEVICLSLAYPAIINTLRHICYYTQEIVELKIIDVKLPLASYDELVNQVANAITEKTRLAVFDHITSATTLLLPLEKLVQECHARGVPVLVDGAHGPGQLKLNLNRLQADFYVGNCYKWLFSSKSCAFLYVSKDQQSNVQPVVTSLGFEQGFVQDFSVQGTRDESSFFTVATAIDFYNSVGADRLYAHNHELINWASNHLAALWNTEVLLPQWQRAPFMSTIRIPLDWPTDMELTNESMMMVCEHVSNILDERCNIIVKILPLQNKMYARISAQIYNDRHDYMHFGEAIKQLTMCDQLNSQFKSLQV